MQGVLSSARAVTAVQTSRQRMAFGVVLKTVELRVHWCSRMVCFTETHCTEEDATNVDYLVANIFWTSTMKINQKNTKSCNLTLTIKTIIVCLEIAARTVYIIIIFWLGSMNHIKFSNAWKNMIGFKTF